MGRLRARSTGSCPDDVTSLRTRRGLSHPGLVVSLPYRLSLHQRRLSATRRIKVGCAGSGDGPEAALALPARRTIETRLRSLADPSHFSPRETPERAASNREPRYPAEKLEGRNLGPLATRNREGNPAAARGSHSQGLSYLFRAVRMGVAAAWLSPMLARRMTSPDTWQTALRTERKPSCLDGECLIEPRCAADFPHPYCIPVCLEWAVGVDAGTRVRVPE